MEKKFCSRKWWGWTDAPCPPLSLWPCKKHLTFLSKGSLVFSVSWELFLTKEIQVQKNMPRIILKERTAHLGSHTFYRRCWSISEHVTFTALSTTKNSFLTEHLSLATLVLWILQVFKNGLFYRPFFTGFLIYTSRSSRLQIFLKTGILKSFANFTGKHLCWSLFSKKLAS